MNQRIVTEAFKYNGISSAATGNVLKHWKVELLVDGNMVDCVIPINCFCRPTFTISSLPLT